MSRFPEVFEEAIDEVVIDEKLLVENLAEHIARNIVERQQALRAEVKIAARYPIERLTPVTALRTQELVTLIGISAARARRRGASSESRRRGSMRARARRGLSARRPPGDWPRPASRKETSSGSSSSSRSQHTTSAAAARSSSEQTNG